VVQPHDVDRVPDDEHDVPDDGGHGGRDAQPSLEPQPPLVDHGVSITDA